MIKLLSILLADDDLDDCTFFKDELNQLPIKTRLRIVNDGEQLMQYLLKDVDNLPDVLFLDLNMPRKNGYECLIEIKKHSLLRSIPVVILSTSFDEKKAEQLYLTGAGSYILKPSNFNELKKSALLLTQQSIVRSANTHFSINELKLLV